MNEMNDAATAKPAVTSALLSRAESMLNMNQSDELWNGAIEAVGRAATYCSPFSTEDLNYETCADWCDVRYPNDHCPWCSCKDCTFCDSYESCDSGPSLPLLAVMHTRLIPNGETSGHW